MGKTRFGQLRFDKTKEEMVAEYCKLWEPVRATETVPLREAEGRVMPREVFSLYDLPVVRSSRMDGICVKSEMFADGLPDTAGWKMGEEYMRADTGDDFDDAYDTVIAIEDVTLADGGVTLDPELKFTPGMNVAPRGSMLKKDAPLARALVPLRALDLAALAMGGYGEVEVYRRPRVAFIPTGSELVPAGAELRRGQNFDSNSILVERTLLSIGAEPVCYPIVRDSLETLRETLRGALADSDVVLINGGSAKGGEDFNARLLHEEGEVYTHGVPAGPGRPMCLAVIGGKPVINVPGPSLGTFFALQWCVSRVVERFLNIPARENPRITGILSEELRCPPHFDFIVRMNVRRTESGYVLYPAGRGSASSAEVSSADAMFVSVKGESLYPKGSELTVEMLRDTGFLVTE
ncbi:MAG: molybdopterin molybdotransferase MoeA [Oscillospiraceae bacterium]|nr:molybdopterin molybdotransferase MoeA [Oscillospiraceae bacterium]